MSDDRHDEQALDGAAELPDERELVRLARSIGRHLRAPIDPQRRREHVERAARAAGSAAGGPPTDGAVPSADRRGVPAASGPDGTRPAGRDADGPRGAVRGAVRGAMRGARRLGTVGVVAVAGLAVLSGVLMMRAGDDLPMITLAGGPAAGGSSPMAARGGAEDMAVGDMSMIWNPVVFEFELADGVRLGAGRGDAWRFEPPADLEARAAELAALLGLPRPTPSEWGDGSLSVTGPDNANLWIGAGGDWYYGGPYDPSIWDCVWPGDAGAMPYEGTDGTEGAEGGEGGEGGSASGGEGGDSTAPDADAPDAPVDGPGRDGEDARDLPLCVEQTPPVGVPSAGEARTLAAAFFTRVGMSGVRILDAYADEWGANVSARIDVTSDPEDAGMWVSVGFGGGSAVTWAGGTLATPVRLGAYPTVDSDASLERLRAQLGGMAGMSGPRPAEAPEDSVAGGSADDVVTILPVPGPSDGDLEPQIVRVRLVSVRLVLDLAWTEQGGLLLVPHHRFVDSDGGVWSVAAVADRYLAG